MSNEFLPRRNCPLYPSTSRQRGYCLMLHTGSGLPGIGQLTPQPQRGLFGKSPEKYESGLERKGKRRFSCVSDVAFREATSSLAPCSEGISPAVFLGQPKPLQSWRFQRPIWGLPGIFCLQNPTMVNNR